MLSGSPAVTVEAAAEVVVQGDQARLSLRTHDGEVVEPSAAATLQLRSLQAGAVPGSRVAIDEALLTVDTDGLAVGQYVVRYGDRTTGQTLAAAFAVTAPQPQRLKAWPLDAVTTEGQLLRIGRSVAGSTGFDEYAAAVFPAGTEFADREALVASLTGRSAVRPLTYLSTFSPDLGAIRTQSLAVGEYVAAVVSRPVGADDAYGQTLATLPFAISPRRDDPANPLDQDYAYPLVPAAEAIGQGVYEQSEWFYDRHDRQQPGLIELTERDRGSVMVVGDSIAASWYGRFEGSARWVHDYDLDFDAIDAGGRIRLSNRSAAADNSRRLLNRFEADIAQADPAAVVLMIGTNDLPYLRSISGNPPEQSIAETVANVEQMIGMLHRADAATPVLLTGVLPSSRGFRPTGTVVELNAAYADLAGRLDNVTYVDTFTPLYEAAGRSVTSAAYERLFYDGLHPGPEGMDLLQETILQGMAGIGLNGLDVDLTLSASTVGVGGRLDVLADARGGGNDRTYRTYVRPLSGGAWTALDRASGELFRSVTFDGLAPGEYELAVRVESRAAAGTSPAERDLIEQTALGRARLIVAAAEVVVAGVPDRIGIGQTATLDAAVRYATDGPHELRAYVRRGPADWQAVGGWSAGPVTVDAAGLRTGEHELMVVARPAGPAGGPRLHHRTTIDVVAPHLDPVKLPGNVRQGTALAIDPVVRYAATPHESRAFVRQPGRDWRPVTGWTTGPLAIATTDWATGEHELIVVAQPVGGGERTSTRATLDVLPRRLVLSGVPSTVAAGTVLRVTGQVQYTGGVWYELRTFIRRPGRDWTAVTGWTRDPAVIRTDGLAAGRLELIVLARPVDADDEMEPQELFARADFTLEQPR